MEHEKKKDLVVHDDVSNLPTKQSSDTMIGLIEKIALMPDSVATENLGKLHEMYKDMQDREAEVMFNRAFVAAQSEMPIVVKDANNDQTSSKYAKLQTITKLIKPIYTKHGFGMIGGMADSPIEKHIRVTIDLIHSSGHSKHYFNDMPIDDKGIKGTVNKTQPHAKGSSTTYAQRYLKCLIWDVQIAEDDDGNGAGEGLVYISDDQKSQILDMIAHTEIDSKRFLNYLRADSIDTIPEGSFKLAWQVLKKRETTNKNRALLKIKNKEKKQ